MSTNEYRRAVNAEEKRSLRPASVEGAVSLGGGALAYPLALAPGPMSDVVASVALAGFIAHAFAGALVAGDVAEYVRWRRHDKTVLAHKDPALVIDVSSLPHDVVQAILLLAGVTPPSTARHERLTLAYTLADTFTSACRDERDWTISALIRRCPAELAELIRYGLNMNLPDMSTYAARLQSTMSALSHPSLSATNTQTEPSPQVRLREGWDDALTSHDALVEAWTDIVCDPLSALEHSALLDMNEARTRDFVQAYGHAQDLRAVHGRAFPVGDSSAAREYLSAVRAATQAWDEALRYSTHVGFGWMPADEAAHARKAASLLSTSKSATATVSERQTAAHMASERLAKVTSFVLPATALHELEMRKRLELLAAESTTPPVTLTPAPTPTLTVKAGTPVVDVVG